MARKTTTKTETLEILVTRSWPLNRLKSVQVKILGKDLWHNDITLTAQQVEDLHVALDGVLYGGQEEPKVVS